MTTATANGKPHKPATPADVRRSLQEQLSTALIAGKHRRARTIAESLLFFDEFGGSDIWDAVRPSSNDGPGATRWVPLGQPSDRRHGADWPVWRTETELFEWLNQARLRLASNAYAQGLLRNRTNNVVGKGYAYTAVPVPAKKAKGKPKGKAPGEGDEGETGNPGEALAEQVQEVIDEFLRLNNFNGGTHASSSGVVVSTREREIFRRVDGDGEAFIRLHFQEDGTTRMRFVEPAQVRSFGDLPQEGWSYGIQHQMDPYEDVEQALAYKFFWPDASAPGGDGGLSNALNYEEVEAREVLHLKGPDTPSTVKRGLSRYLFDTGRALDRASRLQRNASLGAAYRAATGEIWQHQAGTQAQITSLASGLGETGVTTADGSLETVERIRAPAIRRIPASQELVPLPPDQSESYLAAGQGDLQQAGAGFAAPAYWFGDTGEVNYNNAESAAAPAVRDGQCEQEYYKQAYCAVIWRAITWAVECGRLPEGVEDRVKLEVEAPAVLHRNELEKAQEDQIGVSVGWKDPQTCAEERGLDWDTIKARREEYQADQLEQQVAQQEALGLPDEGAGPPQPGQPGPKDGEVKPRVVTPPGGGKEKPAKPPENLTIKPRVATPGGGGGQKARSFGESLAEAFDPSEPRDDSGKWTGGGGGKRASRAEKEAAVRAKVKPEHIEAVHKAIADLGGGQPGRFGLTTTVPETDLLAHLKKTGMDIGATGLKGYQLLDRMVFLGELARHRTGGSPYNMPGVTHKPDEVSYSLPMKKMREGFDPSEPRDDSGQWTAGGGSAGGGDPDAARQARKVAVKQERQHVRKVAGDAFPGAKVSSDGGVLSVRDGNRVVRLEHEPGKERSAVHVEFLMAGSELMPGNMGQTGKELQAGTLDFSRKLSALAGGLGNAGLDVSYDTKDERRARLYAAVLGRSGFEQVKGKAGKGYARWRKKDGAKVREGFDPSEKRDDSGKWTAGGGGGGGKGGGEDKVAAQKVWNEKWVKSLDRDEKEAVQEYTLNSDRINGALRSGTLGGKQAYIVADLDAALDKSVTPHEIAAFRGMGEDPGWEVGDTHDEPGYTSASLARSSAEEFADEHGGSEGGVVIELAIPGGSLAAPIAKLSPSYASENEILAARDSRMKITGRRQDGKRVIYTAVLDTSIPEG